MPKFVYTAKDAEGRKIRDFAQADSKFILLSTLKNQGLTVIDIEEQEKAVSSRKRKFSLFRAFGIRRVPVMDMAMLFQQLSTTIEAGLSLVDSVETIAGEVEKEYFQDILFNVARDMREGFTFSESLSRYPEVFTPLMVSLIESAEESGNMTDTLYLLSEYLERRAFLVQKVRTASIYPALIFGFFLVVLTVVTVFLIPRFQYIYEDFGGALPVMTEIIFKINSVFVSNAHFLFVGIVLVVAGLFMFFKTPYGKYKLDIWKLKIPVLGAVLQKAAISKFSRSLAILLEGGVPVSRALEIVARVSDNSVVKAAVEDARIRIMDGRSISESLRKNPVFPKMMIRMISVGEESGSLGRLLVKVSDFYDQQIDASTSVFVSIIEPALIISIGILVLILVLSIYLPIFKIAMTMGR